MIFKNLFRAELDGGAFLCYGMNTVSIFFNREPEFEKEVRVINKFFLNVFGD